MSVIIRGMSLPKKSDRRECSIAVVQNRPVSIAFSRAKTNPLECFECAEIPTPHGRLIDADALKKTIESIYGGALWTFDCFEFVDEAPTIIEAEASEVDAPKPPECGYIDNEQRTKYAICRPYDGITLNTEVEFLLDHNGDVMLFDSESAAWEYFKPIGITEEEPNAIKVVEYKERESNG